MPTAKKKPLKKTSTSPQPKNKVTTEKSKTAAKENKSNDKVLSSADMKSIEGVVKDLLTNLLKKKKPSTAAKAKSTTKTKKKTPGKKARK